MRWSVGQLDDLLDRHHRVGVRVAFGHQADAVARREGIATGGGSTRYGAQIVVLAGSRDEAIERGRAEFTDAVRIAGLPDFPIVHAEAISESEDAGEPG
jgi:hypothetical protein